MASACPLCGKPLDPGLASCPHCAHTATDLGTGRPLLVRPSTDDLRAAEGGAPTPSTEPSKGPRDLESAAPALKTIGRYKILGKIGAGGMGVVYKAFDEELNRTLALKVMIAGEHASESTIVRFQREARAAARLSHPNIVHVYDVGSVRPSGAGVIYYFAMEFIEGEGLDQVIKERRPEPREAARIVRDVARGLEYAHAQGVVHRDLKPGNILLDRQGQAHLLDFGIAKAAADDMAVTQTGEIIGTANYMPPEQVTGSMKSVDAKSDIYSLGAVLYESLTGRPPFRAETILKVFRLIEEEEPELVCRIAPKVPRDLETICLRAMAKQKHRRYPRAGELAADLDRFLDGRPIEARPPGLLRRAGSKIRRHPTLAVATVLLAAFAAALPLLRPPEPPAPTPLPTGPGDLERLSAAKVHYRQAEDDLRIARATRGAEDRKLRRERFGRALAAADRALGIYPAYAEAYQLRGLVRHELNQPDRALEDFDAALRLDGTLAESYYQRAAIRLDLIAQKTLHGAPFLVELDLAAAYPAERKRILEDLEALRRLQVKPELALLAQARCALAFRESGDPADLIARATASNPTFAEAHALRAELRLRAAESDAAGSPRLLAEAWEAATAALSYEPNLEEALRVRARTAIRLLKPLDAERDLADLLSLAPDEAQTHLDRAVVLMSAAGAMRWRPEITKALDRALALEPGHLRARFLRTVWSLASGRLQGRPDAIRACREELEELLAREPRLPEAYALRLICDHALLDEPAFERHFAEFKKARTDLSEEAQTQQFILVRQEAEALRASPTGAIRGTLAEGLRHLAEGETESARTRLREAAERLEDPAAAAEERIAPAEARDLRAAVRYHLAVADTLRGEPTHALEELERALAGKPGLAAAARRSLDLAPLHGDARFEALLAEAAKH